MPSCNVNWCCEKMPLIIFGSKFPDGLERSFPICHYLVFLLPRVFQHSLASFPYLKKTKHCVIPIKCGVIPVQTKLKTKLETIYWNKLRCNKQAKACLANNSTKQKIPGFLLLVCVLPSQWASVVRGLVHIRDLPISCSAAPSQDYLARIQGWDGFDFSFTPFFLLALHIQHLYTSMSTAIPVQ